MLAAAAAAADFMTTVWYLVLVVVDGSLMVEDLLIDVYYSTKAFRLVNVGCESL